MTTDINKAIERLNATMLAYEHIITAIIQQRPDQEEHLVMRRISRLASATPLTHYQLPWRPGRCPGSSPGGSAATRTERYGKWRRRNPADSAGLRSLT